MLAFLYKVLTDNKHEKRKIYTQILKGGKGNGGTIPPEIVTTVQQPDLVIIDNSNSPASVNLAELTIPFARNIAGANTRKREKYKILASDIEFAGYKCTNLPLEMCSRGHLNAKKKETMIHICHILKITETLNINRHKVVKSDPTLYA